MTLAEIKGPTVPMNSLVKVTIVALCLIACGTATVMVPNHPERDQRAKASPIPVTNGQQARGFWLTV